MMKNTLMWRLAAFDVAARSLKHGRRNNMNRRQGMVEQAASAGMAATGRATNGEGRYAAFAPYSGGERR